MLKCCKCCVFLAGPVCRYEIEAQPLFCPAPSTTAPSTTTTSVATTSVGGSAVVQIKESDDLSVAVGVPIGLFILAVVVGAVIFFLYRQRRLNANGRLGCQYGTLLCQQTNNTMFQYRIMFNDQQVNLCLVLLTEYINALILKRCMYTLTKK